MSAKLPPLPALRSFIAVARLGSVGAAAEELQVTHGAVSHQVHALEEYLGVPLIDRGGRRSGLTENGRIYAYAVRQALDDVAAATARMRYQGTLEQLRVAVLPSFAMHWLMPRLSDLARTGLRVSFSTSMSIIDFEAEPIDCAVRFGQGQWPDLHCERLMGDTLLLVGSPKLFPDGVPNSIEEIFRTPILQATESWSAWLSAAHVELPRPEPILEFTDSTHLLEAVRCGYGIALTRRSLAATLLASGELIRLTKVEVTHSSSYYFAWPHRSHNLKRRLIFLEWLRAQIADYELSQMNLNR